MPTEQKAKQEYIPVGCIPPAHWLYLVVSARGMHAPPPTAMHAPCHAHPNPPHMPPCHACPLPCTPLPCMPPWHACPLPICTCHPPCMPPCYVCPPCHACPPATACPPPQPCMPLTHASENITLSLTSLRALIVWPSESRLHGKCVNLKYLLPSDILFIW